jgi:hypothetical protein
VIGDASGARPSEQKEIGFQSETAGFAALRREWAPDAPLCTLDFRRPDCLIDFRLGGQTVLACPWDVRVLRNGKAQSLREGWTSVCWHADEDCEYLELAMPLARGAALERQLLLSRKLPVLLLADSIRSPEAASWRLEWRWTLSGGAARGLEGGLATRAQKVLGPNTASALLPLFLPADPLAPASGKLTMEGSDCVLAVSEGNGKGLAMPIAWQWTTNGASLASAPWRRLTVTNDGALVGPSEAFAARAAIDGRNFVYFRSTVRERRQAFLGCQTFDECIIGEFTRKGDVKVWLRIE